VGLDRQAAQAAFARFLEGSTYSANQIRFIPQIIEHLTRNGVIHPGSLYDQPFTDYNTEGLDGLFPDEDAQAIMGIIAQINANAVWSWQP
jgi:type I restriction enzyme, R subunit